VLPPGSTIGILGGGQLGRMLALAAAPLGYKTHVYAPDRESVAAEVAAQHTQAAWDDEPRLAAFAAACDAVTIEFENVPVDTVRFLSGHVAVRPGAAALEIAQDRLAEKRFVAGLGGRTAPFAAVPDRSALDEALIEIGAPAILKTVRMGYDGKGQARIAAPADADAAWEAIGRIPQSSKALSLSRTNFQSFSRAESTGKRASGIRPSTSMKAASSPPRACRLRAPFSTSKMPRAPS
jgi:Phosphoribosylaminoimidazole carboxylase (NCAIR synthetase)